MQIAAIKDSGDLHKVPSGKVHYTLMEPEIWKKVPCAHVYLPEINQEPNRATLISSVGVLLM